MSVYNVGREEKLCELAGGAGAVQAAAFSPLGTYLQVFHKPGGGDASAEPDSGGGGGGGGSGGLGEKNLRLYRTSDGGVALASTQKLFSRAHWPPLQWADDESLLLRTAATEAQLLAPAGFASGASVRLRLPGLGSASLSPGPAPLVCAFVPEAKGCPATLRLFAPPACAPGLPPVAACEDGGSAAPLARRAFFRASHAKVRWNPQGTALLALATADVDATNQSYYGESSLHFLRADGQLDAAVALPKDGPVHDVAWASRGTEFVAVYGFMPARCTLYSALTLAPLHEMSPGPFNTARWNPFGRFLMLGGFGNLPGDVSFLDRKADGKVKPMAETRLANAVTAEWSPCGRFLLTATTAPRLNVDNGALEKGGGKERELVVPVASTTVLLLRRLTHLCPPLSFSYRRVARGEVHRRGCVQPRGARGHQPAASRVGALPRGRPPGPAPDARRGGRGQVGAQRCGGGQGCAVPPARRVPLLPRRLRGRPRRAPVLARPRGGALPQARRRRRAGRGKGGGPAWRGVCGRRQGGRARRRSLKEHQEARSGQGQGRR